MAFVPVCDTVDLMTTINDHQLCKNINLLTTIRVLYLMAIFTKRVCKNGRRIGSPTGNCSRAINIWPDDLCIFDCMITTCALCAGFDVFLLLVDLT